MQLYKKHYNHLNSISFSVVFPVGAIHEPKELNGITHLIEHLSFKKTNDLTYKQIYDICESNAVFLNGSTRSNSLEFSFVCRKEVFSKIISVLAGMLECCEYSDEDLRVEKEVIRNEILISGGQTNSKIIENRNWHNCTFGQSVLGSEETLDNITKEQILSYKKIIINSSPKVILVGNYSNNDLVMVESLFSRFGDHEQIQIKEDISLVDDEQITFIKDGYCDIDVYYAYHYELSKENRDAELVCLSNLNNILFRGNTAYYFDIVRNNNGLLYEISSRIVVIENEAILIFWFNSRRDKVYEIMSLIKEGLENFVVDETNYRYQRAYVCDDLVVLQDDISAYVENVSELSILFKRLMSPEEYKDLFLTVDFAEHNKLFKTLKKSQKIYIFGKLSRSNRKAIINLIEN